MLHDILNDISYPINIPSANINQDNKLDISNYEDVRRLKVIYLCQRLRIISKTWSLVFQTFYQ